MRLELRPRGVQEVTTYFYKSDDPEISGMLPRTVTTLDQALENYRASLLPGAASFGQSIFVDGRHIGDVWCCCMEPGGKPEAMVSFCIFDKVSWGHGIATWGLKLFLAEVRRQFALTVFGAFCYSSNAASRRVLEKNGFSLVEYFTEDGVESCYYETLATA